MCWGCCIGIALALPPPPLLFCCCSTHLKFLMLPICASRACTSASVVSKGMLPTAGRRQEAERSEESSKQ